MRTLVIDLPLPSRLCHPNARLGCTFPGCRNLRHNRQPYCEAHVAQKRLKGKLVPLRAHKWKSEEDDRIREWYTKYNGQPLLVRNLAKEINRTERAVFQRAVFLGLTNIRRIKGGRKPENKYPTLEAARRAIGDSTRAWIKANGHPRGALGMKHSAETRKKISETGLASKARETKKARRMRIEKAMRTRAANGTLVQPRQHVTWKSGWREIGGQRCYFRSRWEANYARWLECLKEGGRILKWEHEPETFWFTGIKRGCLSYLPDFRVTFADGRIEYHEVKGWMDPASKTKIRRMKKYHPTVVLVVIGKSRYEQLAKNARWAIAGWEADARPGRL